MGQSSGRRLVVDRDAVSLRLGLRTPGGMEESDYRRDGIEKDNRGDLGLSRPI